MMTQSVIVQLHPAILLILAIHYTIPFGPKNIKLMLAMTATSYITECCRVKHTFHPFLLLTLTWLIEPENCLFHKHRSSAMLVDC